MLTSNHTRRHILPLVPFLRRQITTSNCRKLRPINSKLRDPDRIPAKVTTHINATHFARLSSLLTDPAIKTGEDLEDALTRARIEPDEALFLEIFKLLDSTPKPLFSLFSWAEKQPSYKVSLPVFNCMVNTLGKARKFDEAWCLILGRIDKDADQRPSFDTFAILIRRYTRAGLSSPAVRTFEYASNLDFICNSESEKTLLEILLDSLCKEGHVKVAAQYFDRHKEENPSWTPSIRVYNILLNGWFRSRKLKHAERLWMQMKRDRVKPGVVTYGTLVEGLCCMHRPEMAMDLVNEMKSEKIEPNAIVYNPIIDELGEAGRFSEALGLLERLSVLESGPTISTYNSLVKGFCKAGDMGGASKILKMMVNNGFAPTVTTYNYFLRYFSKFGKIEEGLSLYTKLIRSGYEPDRLTYHLLVKMLCEKGSMDLTMQVISEMRARGCDLDLATCTMLIHLLCKMHRFDEAFREFEGMICRGIVPQYLTYQRMLNELKKQGMIERAQKISSLMASIPHSKKLPDNFKGFGDYSHERKKSVMQKAQAMSNILKTCTDPRMHVKSRRRVENEVSSAVQLMDDIKKKINLTQDSDIPV